MSIQINLNPVSRITTGAVGRPGARTFYLQARDDDQLVTLVLEKEQVRALSTHITALLTRLEQMSPAEEGSFESDPGFEEPIEPVFRVGDMALGYDQDRDLVLLQCGEATGEVEQPDMPDEADQIEREFAQVLAEEAAESSTANFWASRSQMRALAHRGAEAVEAGRPTCPKCGNPMDPAGHQCPARNGHHKLGS